MADLVRRMLGGCHHLHERVSKHPGLDGTGHHAGLGAARDRVNPIHARHGAGSERGVVDRLSWVGAQARERMRRLPSLPDPPGVGKTSVAMHLVEQYPVRVLATSFGKHVYESLIRRTGMALSYAEFRVNGIHNPIHR